MGLFSQINRVGAGGGVVQRLKAQVLCTGRRFGSHHLQGYLQPSLTLVLGT